jgi:hypothetical protein
MHGLLYLHRVLACYDLAAVVYCLVNDGVSSTTLEVLHRHAALIARNNLIIEHIAAAVNLDKLLVSRSEELVGVSSRNECDAVTHNSYTACSHTVSTIAGFEEHARLQSRTLDAVEPVSITLVEVVKIAAHLRDSRTLGIVELDAVVEVRVDFLQEIINRNLVVIECCDSCIQVCARIIYNSAQKFCELALGSCSSCLCCSNVAIL